MYIRRQPLLAKVQSSHISCFWQAQREYYLADCSSVSGRYLIGLRFLVKLLRYTVNGLSRGVLSIVILVGKKEYAKKKRVDMKSMID